MAARVSIAFMLVGLLALVGAGCGGGAPADDEQSGDEVRRILRDNFAEGALQIALPAPNTFTSDEAHEREVVDLLESVGRGTESTATFRYVFVVVDASVDAEGRVSTSNAAPDYLTVERGAFDVEARRSHSISEEAPGGEEAWWYEEVRDGRRSIWRYSPDETWRSSVWEIVTASEVLDGLELPQMLATDGIVEFHDLGTETIDNVATRHYRIVRENSVVDFASRSETEIWIDDDSRLRRGRITFFYSGLVTTCVLDIPAYDEPVTIVVPPEDEIVDGDDSLGEVPTPLEPAEMERYRAFLDELLEETLAGD